MLDLFLISSSFLAGPRRVSDIETWRGLGEARRRDELAHCACGSTPLAWPAAPQGRCSWRVVRAQADRLRPFLPVHSRRGCWPQPVAGRPCGPALWRHSITREGSL